MRTLGRKCTKRARGWSRFNAITRCSAPNKIVSHSKNFKSSRQRLDWTIRSRATQKLGSLISRMTTTSKQRCLMLIWYTRTLQSWRRCLIGPAQSNRRPAWIDEMDASLQIEHVTQQLTIHIYLNVITSSRGADALQWISHHARHFILACLSDDYRLSFTLIFTLVYSTWSGEMCGVSTWPDWQLALRFSASKHCRGANLSQAAYFHFWSWACGWQVFGCVRCGWL